MQSVGSKVESVQIDLHCLDDNISVVGSEVIDQTEITYVADSSKQENDQRNGVQMKYKLDDIPPWYACLAFGLQHHLSMFAGSLFVPFVMADLTCVPENERNTVIAQFFSAIVLTEAVGTYLQTTFGTRLPIVQGIAGSLLVPASVVMATQRWKCADSEIDLRLNDTENAKVEYDITYSDRVREIQGATLVAACFQILIGLSGAIGFVLHYVGPLTVAPTISLIGVALTDIALPNAKTHLGIAFLTAGLMIMFYLYMGNIKLPYPWCTIRKQRRCYINGAKIFSLFPVLIAILISWLFCYILTETGVFTDDPSDPSYQARTDRHADSIASIPWVWFPLPFRWGVPTVSVAAVIGMCAGVIASIIDAVGDYYACAAMSGAPPPPGHAINRGISVEGLAGLFAGMWGSLGVTSYSQNIGAIAITKVASRRVFQWTSLLLFIFAVVGKAGAVVASLPTPIVGGVLWVISGIIVSIGVSSLKHTDMTSTRNLSIFGFAFISGIMIPAYLNSEPGIIQTGSFEADQVLDIILKTGMLVGGFLGFVLDNTVPGTAKERGLLSWREYGKQLSEEKPMKSYDLPFGMSRLRKWRWTRYIPICPTFMKKQE
ncbi:solute carrier family 23 member 2-like [Ptychodera flava]|uniref:solute carrier family 23 member 2-like n=1 Tax=Ptychodera flava TaxID=63121 RepID=UPI00396A1D8D